MISYFKHDLLLVGAGHSNVQVLRAFGMKPDPDIRVTVVAREAHSPYSGMLPGFVYGKYSWDDIHVDLAKLCAFAHARLIIDEVIQIDPTKNLVCLTNRPELRYDCLVTNTGGEPGIAFRGRDNVTAVKPIGRFTTDWNFIVARGESGKSCKLVIVGGGPGSIEVALATRERFGSVFDITIATADPELMIQHNRAARKKIARILQRHSIHVELNFLVAQVTDDTVVSQDGSAIECEHVIWVTGVEAPTWIRKSGFDVDDGGFLRVDRTLRSISHRNVFAGGDMVCLVGQERPKSGVYAVREGPILAKNARAYLKGKQLREYRAQAQALAILRLPGDDALASRGPWCLRSKLISVWKHRIDVKFMRRFSELPKMVEMPAKNDNQEQTRCGGCASKLGARLLDRVLTKLKANDTQDVVSDMRDDAAVVEFDGSRIATTCDHFRAMITDPHRFGRIAASHALNDLYAMGATPKVALVTITLPLMEETLMEDDFYQVLSGAVSVFGDDGVKLVGGHSAEGSELSVGFSVTGTPPEVPWFRANMLPHQDLILTKPLGTGILLAGVMQLKTRAADLKTCIESMELSNKDAAALFREFGASTVTDISGFGLAGHGVEFVEQSKVNIDIFANAINLLPGTRSTLELGVQSTLHDANADVLEHFEVAAEIDELALAPLVDPQTSGGLLAAVPKSATEDCLAALQRAGYSGVCVVGRSTDRSTSRILSAVG